MGRNILRTKEENQRVDYELCNSRGRHVAWRIMWISLREDIYETRLEGPKPSSLEIGGVSLRDVLDVDASDTNDSNGDACRQIVTTH